MTGLRRGVLAVSVLDDIDVEPRDDGVALPGTPEVLVSWDDLRAAAGGQEPASPLGRLRVGSLLRLRRRVADAGEAGADVLRASAVALALPSGHGLHPGRAWVLGAVPGGALDLGVGLDGRLVDRSDPVPLTPELARAAGADVAAWWPALLSRVEGMGRLAAARVQRGGAAPVRSERDAVLRPVGSCDVLTLLASATLRAALAGLDGSGMRAVAVPVRSRGWWDVARVDPAYVASVWTLTTPSERGVARPLLVTRDEVALPRDGGDVTRHAVER